MNEQTLHDLVSAVEQPRTASVLAEERVERSYSATATPDLLRVRDLRLHPHLAGSLAQVFRDLHQERRHRAWRNAFFLLLVGATLPFAMGMVVLAMRSSVQPYVIERDKLGHVVALGPAEAKKLDDPLMVQAQLMEWIEASRSVVRDRYAQDKHTKKTWALVASESLASRKVSEWYTKERLFSNARRSIDVSDVHAAFIPESERSWKLEWTETLYEDAHALPRVGHFSAHVTIMRPPKQLLRKEDDIHLNPANFFITDIVVSNR